jgi:hypothetical protein
MKSIILVLILVCLELSGLAQYGTSGLQQVSFYSIPKDSESYYFDKGVPAVPASKMKEKFKDQKLCIFIPDSFFRVTKDNDWIMIAVLFNNSSDSIRISECDDIVMRSAIETKMDKDWVSYRNCTGPICGNGCTDQYLQAGEFSTLLIYPGKRPSEKKLFRIRIKIKEEMYYSNSAIGYF